MLRKLSETFTATHFTILALGAMFIPGALYATVATTAVSITDPNLGTKSLVDAGRRLYVYDPIAGYRNNPANAVKYSMDSLLMAAIHLLIKSQMEKRWSSHPRSQCMY